MLLTILSALLPAFAFWGFTVDDALISARMAHHLATGIGYRFNAGGEAVDAVTPLGFAHLLSLFAQRSALDTLLAGKVLGIVSYALAVTWLGFQIARAGKLLRSVSVLAVLSACAPLAAWSVAGMETGLVIALATFAVGKHRFAPLCAGLAAALRPELIPWASVLGIGRGLVSKSPQRALVLFGYAVLPALVVVGIRLVVFGRAAPLAIFAKPSDFGHGLRYALGALFFSGIPVLLLAPRALLAVPAAIKVVVAAVVTHWLSLIAAGGDWMAFYRLATPVLPGALLAAAYVAQVSGRWTLIARTTIAVFFAFFLSLERVHDARHITKQRAALISEAAPLLAQVRHVATLDVGWVGAATSQAVLDLAGVTDPSVAFLPGGHTTKAIPERLLESRGVDALVLLLADCSVNPDAWWTTRFARGVEQRIAAFEFARRFEFHKTLELRGTPQCYVVLIRPRNKQ